MAAQAVSQIQSPPEDGLTKERMSISSKDPEQLDDTESLDAFPEGGARAWAVAAGAAGVMFCTMGYVNTWGVYQEYYESNILRDQSPSAISWIGSLQTFFLFSGALVGGPLFDRHGAKVIWVPAFLYVVSIMLTSICKEYWHFMLAQGVLGGISNGMTMAPSMAATPQYFNKNRGAAMGFAIAGSSLGGVIFPIALAKMFANPDLGFAWGVRIVGFMMLAILLASCLAIKARLPPRKENFLLLSAFKDMQFIAIVGAAFLMIIGMFTPMVYLPSYAVAHGMSRLLASYLVAIVNAASFFGRVIPGVLADKFGRLNSLLFAGFSTGIMIFCWQKATTNATIITVAAIFGFCSGAIISAMSVSLVTVPKDPRNIGTYMGQGMFVVAISALIGPPINGALIKKYHSFDQATIFSGTMVLVGAASVLLAKQATGKGILSKV